MQVSPAQLFLEYWGAASQWSQNVALRAMRPSKGFEVAIQSALMIAEGDKSYAAIRELVSSAEDGIEKGRMLTALSLIDRFFDVAHPRVLTHSSMKEKLPLTHWIRGLIYHRDAEGCFYKDDDNLLIPKGTLTRLSRTPFITSAYCFSDCFCYLSVVPRVMKNDEQRVTVTTVKIGGSSARGVGTSLSDVGFETVGIIPIAEDANHLDLQHTVRDGVNYIDACASKSIDVPSLVMTALSNLGMIDIAIAPELLISEIDCDKISAQMRITPSNVRMFVAGSGNTVEKAEDQPWNESRVLNRFGLELWRQRKIWQAGFDQHRAAELGINISADAFLMEDNCAGAEVVVADVEGLGRCVVLICQDLQMAPLTGDLIRYYQPDWVFTPILDWGAHAGRWTHQRAWDLSAISPARYVVASSTALAHILGKALPSPAGLLVGPREEIGPDSGRLCSQVYADGSHPSTGVVQWRVGTWNKSMIGTDETLARK
jgi:hypothetical protein